VEWDLKQCEDLAALMAARREELGEVKRVVDGIAAVFYIDQTCRQTGLSRSAKTPTRPTVGRTT